MLNETNGAPENNLSPNTGFPLFFVYKRIYNELIVNMPVLKAIVIYWVTQFCYYDILLLLICVG